MGNILIKTDFTPDLYQQLGEFKRNPKLENSYSNLYLISELFLTISVRLLLNPT